jgi:hypothetical protein
MKKPKTRKIILMLVLMMLSPTFMLESANADSITDKIAYGIRDIEQSMRETLNSIVGADEAKDIGDTFKRYFPHNQLVELTPEQREELFGVLDTGKPLLTKPIETKRGIIDVPYIPIRWGESQFEKMLADHREAMKALDESLAAENYYWCFQCVEITNDCAHRQPAESPPHPFLIGYCPSSRLPVFKREGFPGSADTINIGTEWYEALKPHAVKTYIAWCGGIMTFEVDPVVVGTTVLRLLLNGEEVHRQAIGVNRDYELPGFVMIYGNDMMSVRFLVETPHMSEVRPRCINTVTIRNIDARVQPVTGELTLPQFLIPPRPPTGITINPDFDIEKIMSEISALSKHIDRAKDEIIIRIPIITPCSFPEIPEYDFEEFKRDILEEIKNLGNEFNVVNVAKEEENEPGFFQRLRDRIVDFSGLPGLPKIDLPGLSGLYSWLRNILPGLPEIKFPDFAGLIGDIARALTGVISSIRNIYNFLKTIVDLLIVGLRNLFELIFIPPDDFFQNNFNKMRDELNFKLPFQGFIAQIEQLSHMPPPPGRYELLPVGDDFFPAPPMTEIKLLDTEGTINYFLDFIRPHLDPARILISGLYGIFLVYFNIRQMLFLLRGTTFNGMANTIGRMGD